MTSHAAHQPILCRAHLHHKWIQDRNPDGKQYMRCARCKKDRTEFDRDSTLALLGAALGEIR